MKYKSNDWRKQWKTWSTVSTVHSGRVEAASSTLPTGLRLALEQLDCACSNPPPTHTKCSIKAGKDVSYPFCKVPNLSLLYNMDLEPVPQTHRFTQVKYNDKNGKEIYFIFSSLAFLTVWVTFLVPFSVVQSNFFLLMYCDPPLLLA